MVSTRGGRAVSFVDAVKASVPPEGGLYLPIAYPTVHPSGDFAAIATAVLDPFVGDELPVAELVREAFDFPVPVVPIDDRIAALELFHGPSLAFKDFGARFLAGVLARVRDRDVTILTATSGDTGAAVASAFAGRDGFRVVVLFPRGRISALQERQLTSLGGNVAAYAVDGAFDDCQSLVKACFADPAVREKHGLVSANSINVARLLAQVAYFFVPDADVIAVPSGNFGNLSAGLIARKLGLRATLVAATNANDTVPAYLDGGPWAPKPSVATLSNAMDVGAPNNWERVLALCGGVEGARTALRWGSATDDQTADAMRALDQQGYVADPHAAVAWSVLTRVLRPGERGVFLGTAHPAKFLEVVRAAIGREPELPASLAAIRGTASSPEHLPNDLAELVSRLDAR
jgi:threonine synthase